MSIPCTHCTYIIPTHINVLLCISFGIKFITRGSTLLYGVSTHTVRSIWLIKNSRCDRNNLRSLVVRHGACNPATRVQYPTWLHLLFLLFLFYVYKFINVSQNEHNGLYICLSHRKNCFTICPYYTDIVRILYPPTLMYYCVYHFVSTVLQCKPLFLLFLQISQLFTKMDR